MTDSTRNADLVANLTTSQIHHARLKKATKLAAMLDGEYPKIALGYTQNEVEHVTGWYASIETSEDESALLYEGDKVPELADLLEACEELDVDPSDEDEEQERSGSVVREEYRKRYHETSSNGQSCGDWLAEWLTEQTWSPVNGLMVEDFTAVLCANGVDMTRPWAKLPESGQNGWRGRYRMNGRQALEKHVAYNGYVYTAQGAEIEVPAEALKVLRERHAKWIAKQRKAEEASDDLAK